MAKRKKKKVKYTAEEEAKREREKIALIARRRKIITPPFLGLPYFYKHSETGEVYAISFFGLKTFPSRITGEKLFVVESAGPLDENDLKDLNSYEYTTDRNDWLNENKDKMIRMRKRG